MPYGRRLVYLLVALAAIAVPAIALRAACVGNSCGTRVVAPARIPFCSLPAGVREQIAAGFRSGRSPDVLAVPRDAVLWGGAPNRANDGVAAAWPSVEGAPSAEVPLVLSGAGIDPDVEIPDGTRLDAVAPTIADVIGFRRPFPGVRSGVPIPGVAGGAAPRLVVLVVWKGVGTPELRKEPASWPALRALIRRGAGTTHADVGSSPADPAAILTSIGTGGLPSDHGITATALRNDCASCGQAGRLARAWEDDAPPSIIATLGDDLDERLGQEPLVGLVASDPADRGVIGGEWYIPHDRDRTVITDPRGVVDAVAATLRGGFGTDAVPDILAVVVGDSIGKMDGQLGAIADLAEREAGGRVAFAVTSTGSAPSIRGARAAVEGVVAAGDDAIPGSTPGVQAAVPGGLFLNQDALEQAGVSSNVAVEALRRMRDPSGEPLFADVFPSFAVSFERYCDG